jgi:hypothetical protein
VLAGTSRYDRLQGERFADIGRRTSTADVFRNATCYPTDVFKNIGVFNSCTYPDQDRLTVTDSTIRLAINIATDLIFALIPIPIVWKLQVNLRTRIGLGAILGLGLLYVPGRYVILIGTDIEQCVRDGDIQDPYAVQLLQRAGLVR